MMTALDENSERNALPANAVGVFRDSAGGGMLLYDRAGRVIAA
jgi:hypothetical protein